MIIFGTRGITTTPERGQFYCPQCQSNQSYNFKRVRRFFTLYFIPVIPLNKLGEYVECPACQGTYDPEILSFDPAENDRRIEAFFFIAVKQVMIAILLADGVIDDDEVMMLQQIYEKLTGTQVPEDELREEIAVLQAGGHSATELITNISPQLNDSGKETVIRAAYAIAASDGNVDETEIATIAEVASAMGLSQAHLNGVLADAAQNPLAIEGEAAA